MTYKIGFAGTDGRTLLGALVVSTAKSEKQTQDFEGTVIRGTPAMLPFAEKMGWPVKFIPTANNSVESYASTIIEALKTGQIDCVIPMPEDLFYNGLVNKVTDAGLGNKIAGLTKRSSFLEGDKIACKRTCRSYDIPTADEWLVADARFPNEVMEKCWYLIGKHGGAVLKYPYSAGGKGSRIISNPWEIDEVYNKLLKDYGENYEAILGKISPWPLLIESKMSDVEISLVVLVDNNGHFQVLPTSMDYPERYAGTASISNPITGGMGSISPHPMESRELIELAKETVVRPLIKAMKKLDILRPCILYPGCMVSFGSNKIDGFLRPTRIRVCEINIRPPEPEFQPVARRVRNLGTLIKAMFYGNLDEVIPEIRTEQISMNIALVTGPGGLDGQKGYPWSYTKGERMEIDYGYFEKQGIQIIPSNMNYVKGIFESDGSRVAFLNANATIKNSVPETAERLRTKLLSAFDGGKIRVMPRENPSGNRLDLRRDIGWHFSAIKNLR
ncbi:MAG: hypothetical protein Q7R75_02600 [bacterium]|nr:hypothetical protein [bacterium]